MIIIIQSTSGYIIALCHLTAWKWGNLSLLKPIKEGPLCPPGLRWERDGGAYLLALVWCRREKGDNCGLTQENFMGVFQDI